MFKGFAGVWTPAALSGEVRKRPHRVILAGEAVVLFRDAAGSVRALADRCPHRAASLALGCVRPDGTIECPFHGWRFDGAGANRHVPLNPDVNRDHLGTKAFPTFESGGLIWIFTGEGPPEPAQPILPAGLFEPELRRVFTPVVWACHWTRVMENMLDSPHLPFVHRRTIGRPLRRVMHARSEMRILWEETDYGGIARTVLDGREGGGMLEFHRPNVMSLTIPFPKRRFRIHALVIPAAENQTRLIVGASRDFARWAPLDLIFQRSNRRIAEEDHAVVESSGPGEVPPVGAEKSVPSDRATLAFRRYYYSRLREP
jgi:phenylpropionate dioxygenase-like ring-hydroxylating dioxygenase large terminal subunit